MLGTDARIIKSSTDGVRFDDLTRLVLEDVGADTVEHTWLALRERRAVPVAIKTFTASLDADQLNLLVGNEVEESANCVASATDARYTRVGKLADLRLELLLNLRSDDTLEIAHDGREGVRANGGPHEVVRRGKIRDPIAHGLVHGVFQRARARVDRNNLQRSQYRSHVGTEGDSYLAAEHTDTEDVQCLSAYVLGAHVNDALQSKARAYGRRRDTVLTSAGLCDDTLFTYAACEEYLSQRVVDLVRPSVVAETRI